MFFSENYRKKVFFYVVCIRYFRDFGVFPIYNGIGEELPLEEQKNVEVLKRRISLWCKHLKNTVDGWNPAPPGMYETLKIMGKTTNLNWCRISAINSITIISPLQTSRPGNSCELVTFFEKTWVSSRDPTSKVVKTMNFPTFGDQEKVTLRKNHLMRWCFVSPPFPFTNLKVRLLLGCSAGSDRN